MSRERSCSAMSPGRGGEAPWISDDLRTFQGGRPQEASASDPQRKCTTVWPAPLGGQACVLPLHTPSLTLLCACSSPSEISSLVHVFEVSVSLQRPHSLLRVYYVRSDKQADRQTNGDNRKRLLRSWNWGRWPRPSEQKPEPRVAGESRPLRPQRTHAGSGLEETGHVPFYLEHIQKPAKLGN